MPLPDVRAADEGAGDMILPSHAFTAMIVVGMSCGMAMANGVNVDASFAVLVVCCGLASFMR
jgi:hypothetical protein